MNNVRIISEQGIHDSRGFTAYGCNDCKQCHLIQAIPAGITLELAKFAWNGSDIEWNKLPKMSCENCKEKDRN